MLLSEFVDPKKLRSSRINKNLKKIQSENCKTPTVREERQDEIVVSGVGRYTPAGLRADLMRKLKFLVDRIQNDDYDEAYYHLYKNPVLELMLDTIIKQSKKKSPESRNLQEDQTKKLTPAERVSRELGMSPEQYRAYRNAIAEKESAGRYDIVGGANNHYQGRYQMGYRALRDAGRSMGITVPDYKKDPEGYKKFTKEFRENPDLQDAMFDQYTANNLSYLKHSKVGGEQFRNADSRTKAQVLGMAHNSGYGPAAGFLVTGKDSKDAFGTSGASYRDLVAKALADPQKYQNLPDPALKAGAQQKTPKPAATNTSSTPPAATVKTGTGGTLKSASGQEVRSGFSPPAKSPAATTPSAGAVPTGATKPPAATAPSKTTAPPPAATTPSAGATKSPAPTASSAEVRTPAPPAKLPAPNVHMSTEKPVGVAVSPPQQIKPVIPNIKSDIQHQASALTGSDQSDSINDKSNQLQTTTMSEVANRGQVNRFKYPGKMSENRLVGRKGR